jgi:BRO family, N-terminal domain
MSSDDRTVAVIEEQADATIRHDEVDGVMYFSVIDVIAILTDSAAPRKYWNAMKARITEEGFVEASTKCRQLKLLAADGKARTTDAADTETLLRIIQSVPSPKAEPIKQWLARVGARAIRLTNPEVPVSLGSSIAEVKQHKPADDDLLGMAEWYEQLARVYRQQANLESRLRFVESASRSQGLQLEELTSRLQRVEEAQELLPGFLESLRPERLTPQHQSLIRRWVIDLHHLTGWHIDVIYQDLVTDFELETLSDARESDWERITTWFRERLAEARKPR